MALCGSCFREYSGDVCPYCGFDSAAETQKYALALRSGSILGGHYIVGRVLGQGGFGITYSALDYDSKKLVAIKEHFPSAIVTRSLAGTVSLVSHDMADSFKEGKEKFLAEAKTLSTLNRLENICDIYRYFEENGTAYFAMEYVDGIPLDAYIKKLGRLLSFEEALRLLLPVMNALCHVHAEGIIHRDLSPDNIMVTPYNGVMLIDFGAARYSMGEKSRSLDVILKHGFAPKEQYARHGRQGAYTDVYAMAATFYYAITGKVPPDAIERSDDDELAIPSRLGVKIPRKAEQILLKALAVDYKQRFQTMDEFSKKLAVFLPDIKREQDSKLAAQRQEEAEKREAEKKAQDEKRAAQRRAKEEQRAAKAEKAEKKTENAGQSKPARNKKPLGLIAALAAIAIGAGAFFALSGEKAESPVVTEAPAASETPVVSETPSPTEAPAVIDWELNNGTLTISGTGKMENFSPGVSPWANRFDIRNIIIEEGITDIGKYAFVGCTSLQEISLPNSVTAIGNSAFEHCVSLRELIIPGNTKTIGLGAFLNCSSLNSVTIPNSIVMMEDYAFSGCEALDSVTFTGTEEQWNSIEFGKSNDVLLNASINFTAVAAGDCGADVSWTLDRNGTLTVSGEGKMEDFQLIIDGDSSRKATDQVTNLVISEGVTGISKAAFSGYRQLRTVSFPSTLKSIGQNAFGSCDALRTLELPEGLADIGNGAFTNCYNLSSVSLPEELKTIGPYAFFFCYSIYNMDIPDSVTSIGASAFAECQVLQEISLPDGLKTIPEECFKGCRSLYKATLPASLNTVERDAFLDCPLRTVEFMGTPEQWDKITIASSGNTEGNRSLRNANVNFKYIVSGTAGEGITWNIDQNGTLTVSGKGDMKHFGTNSTPLLIYVDCVTEMVVEEGITGINSRALANCDTLLSLTLPSTLKSIDNEAFYNCKNLRNINFSEGLTTIGEGAFMNCKSLTSIVIPESVTDIGDSAFRACTALSSVTLPSGLTAINYDVFRGCTVLRSITVPEGVSELGDWCFADSGLSSISLPGSLTYIGMNSFKNCASLRSVEFMGTEQQWQNIKIGTNNDALQNASKSYSE